MYIQCIIDFITHYKFFVEIIGLKIQQKLSGYADIHMKEVSFNDSSNCTLIKIITD